LNRTNIMKKLIVVILVILSIVAAGCTSTQAPASTAQPNGLKVKWFGQSAFSITSASGFKVITDPYTPTTHLTYGEIRESADIVTVSHEHGDHNNTGPIQGNPAVIRTSTELKNIRFKAVATFHDASQGKERGSNTVFCFELDGIKICHLGDLGHLLSDQQIADIGKVDILLIPVGGYYTIDAAAASQVVDQIKPSVVIPMHYKTNKYDGPLAAVDDFLKGKKNINASNSGDTEFKAGSLPSSTQIVVLKPSN
jgi:L-ascorbate metabolism protein UlaG (beta-lactamase superfamily)